MVLIVKRLTRVIHICYDDLMPKKDIQFTKTITIRLTVEMYNIVRVMARTYGNDADVLRAGILALWREFDNLPSAEEAPPVAPAADVDEA